MGLVTLNVLQIFYISRLKWKEISQKANDLCKEDGHKSHDSENRNVEIGETHNKSKRKLNSKENNTQQTSAQTQSLRLCITKRVIIFIIFVVIFIASIFTRNIAADRQNLLLAALTTTTTTLLSSLK